MASFNQNYATNNRTRAHGTRQQKDLVCVRDIPPLDPSNSDASDKYAIGFIPEIDSKKYTKTLGISRRPTPRHNDMQQDTVDDNRQDDHADIGGQILLDQGEQQRDIGGDRILPGMSSLTDENDSRGESLSGESNLVFPLDRLSSEHSSGDPSRTGITTYPEQNDIRGLGKSDFGVSSNTGGLGETSSIDETPRMDNRIPNESTSKSKSNSNNTMGLLFAIDESRQNGSTNTSHQPEKRLYNERSRSLDSKAGWSPKSLASQEIRDFLIQDCVETGLPSPGKKNTAFKQTREAETLHFTFSACSSHTSIQPTESLHQNIEVADDNAEKTRVEVSLACSSTSEGSSSSLSGSLDSIPQCELQHSISRQPSPQLKGLAWWRQHGKQAVEAKRKILSDRAPVMEGIAAPSQKVQTQKFGTENRLCAQILPETQQSCSDSNGSSACVSATSAFQRGMSIFEKVVSSTIFDPERKLSSHRANGEPLESSARCKDGDYQPKDPTETDSDQVNLQLPKVHQRRPRHEDSSSDEGASGLLSPRVMNSSCTDSKAVDNHDPPQATPAAPGASTPQSRFLSPSMKMMVLAGESNMNINGGSRDSSSQSSSDGETDYAADILNVASSISTKDSSGRKTENGVEKVNVTTFCPTPIASTSSVDDDLQTQTIELKVGVDNIPSFDAKGCASGAGVPSWRLSHAENLSDFKVSIKTMRSKSVDEYHIHKHIIGVGPRRSEVLEAVFRSSAHPWTEITVVDEATALLPSVLDFMYCNDYELELQTGNVLAYRYLANLARIPSILTRTSDFVLKDMRIENMATYISQSSLFRDEVVTRLIAARCGEEIGEIELSDKLWTEMDPKLFYKVISCPRIDRRKTSRRNSRLVTKYYAIHKKEINPRAFHDMTVVSVLPLIDRTAAIPLLEICDELGAPSILQKLQKRCAHVMACNWKTTNDADRKRLFTLLRSLSSTFTVDFLEMVESGKTTSLVDDAMLKMIGSVTKMRESDENYEAVETFTRAKLCGGHMIDARVALPLSWSMGAVQSFSDWTLKVKHEGADTVDIYHIHKHMVAIGQYKSTYFASTFLEDGKVKAIKGNTTIELSEQSAKLVPVILDFMYSPSHPLPISTQTAPALRFLSRLFGIYMLNKVVIEFLQQDICLKNMIDYLDSADLYDDERIRNIAVCRCAMNIVGIDAKSKLLLRFTPEFFGRIIASGDIDKGASCHINVLIATYFTNKDLSETLLAELMKQVPMKEIDQESALQLLHVMGSLSNTSITVFADICKRCANVLIKCWKDVRHNNREECFRILRTLGNSALVTEIFEAVEKESNDELYEAITSQAKVVKKYRTQLTEAESRHEQTVAQLRHDHEILVMEMAEKQKYLEAELESFRSATDRRAIRSSTGGFRYLSPPRSPQNMPMTPQLSTPRLSNTTASPRTELTRPLTESPTRNAKTSKVSRSENQRGQREGKKGAGPSRAQQTSDVPKRSINNNNNKAGCEGHASIFSQVFGCTPEKPLDHDEDQAGQHIAPYPQLEPADGDDDYNII